MFVLSYQGHLGNIVLTIGFSSSPNSVRSQHRSGPLALQVLLLLPSHKEMGQAHPDMFPRVALVEKFKFRALLQMSPIQSMKMKGPNSQGT